MARLFRDHAAGASPATRELADRLDYTMADLGYRFPDYPVPAGRDDGVVSAEDHAGRRARALSAVSRSRARADRARARSDREARSRRLLPDRLGHRQFLPAAGHPRAGARLGRQQRRLLQPRHHRGRSGRHGAAVRAVPVGGARRVAGHRSRSAERRSARAGDPARLRKTATAQLRAARDDRQRDHLSRPQRRARSRQGAVARAGAGRSAGQGDEPLRVRRSERDARAQPARGRPRRPASGDAAVRRAVAAHPGSAAPSRPALGRHGDLPGPARRGGAARERQHARTASSCSGTRTTAPTWASSRSICSGSG